MNRLFLAVTATFVLLLAACGGGGSSVDQPLSIADGAPEAYSTAYLDAHPNLLVQPEHLVTGTLSGLAPLRVRLHIRAPMTLSVQIDSTTSTPLIAKLAIVDPSGMEVLGHRVGEDRISVQLQPGAHTVILTPNAAADDGVVHRIYLKLAETDSQRQRRSALRLLSASASASASASSTATTALGAASTDNCIGCSFQGADLAGEDFSGQSLSLSNFDGSNLTGAHFAWASCVRCLFTHVQANQADFQNAGLASATISPSESSSPYAIVQANFGGANMDQATLLGIFSRCEFGPSVTSGRMTSLRSALLADAVLEMIGIDHSNFVQGVDFTGATLSATSLHMDYNLFAANGPSPMYVGTRFDNVVFTTPGVFGGDFFQGFDLSGTSFAGVDLSTANLSVANSVKLSTTTDLSKAILSNGVIGTNLSGQAALFQSPFVAWAGTPGIAASGKDLRYVNLSNVDLTRADLSYANLSGANLVGTNLTLANLYAVKLNGAQLGVAPGAGTQAAADLSNAYMPFADLSDADLRSVNLQNAHLYGEDGTPVMFTRARLDSASLANAQLMDTDFTQASLNDTDFSGAALVNAKFSGAMLTNTKFSSAVLFGADFSNVASITGIRLDSALLVNIGSAYAKPYPFRENNGVSIDFDYADTQLGPIATLADAVCPNGESGPCATEAKLTPIKAPAYPVPPACVPTRSNPDACDP